jgi:endonuclease/exonuclease/phosphatase family metal-dependent hydrolase
MPLQVRLFLKLDKMQILTLNIWGAPYAKHRSERIKMIASEIRQNLKPDILCFQEVYMSDNRRQLIDLLKDDYPHYHFFASGVIGSGLLTMSCYPIVDALFHRFRMSGKPKDIAHGDYYAGKGIGLTRIDTPDGSIDVYNCHTHAQYEYENDNEYAVYNETNLYEAARFIYANSGNCPTVLCGDLNTCPDQAGYEIITKLGNLSNAYYSLHEKFPITFSADNPYVESPNQCLDYVLLRNADVKTIEVVMEEHFSGVARAYSDHYGLLAEISLENKSTGNDDVEPVMQALYKRVKIALAEAENEQMGSFVRIFIALIAIADGMVAASFLRYFSRSLARFVRRMSLLAVIGFALFQVVQAGLNLQARRNTLNEIEQELKRQIEAKRLFDGREF